MPREAVDLRAIALGAYGPSLLYGVATGAILPVIALTARDLGADVATAALVITLSGIGSLVTNVPATLIATRFGERKALVGAALWCAAAMFLALAAPTLPVFAAAVFMVGMAGAVFGLARQSYLTEAVPAHFRARALSTLGGVFRVGNLLGPLAGAAVVSAFDLRAAYWLAIGTSLAAAATSLFLPDLPEHHETTAAESTGMGAVLREHARTFLTIGLGASALMLVRASRDALLPLWAASIGLDAAQTSLIFAASSAIDLMLSYIGGSMMDRYGRRSVAVPTMLIMGACFGLLPLTATGLGLTAVAVGLGLGNGLSSGVVLTLGSDASPDVGRTHFLAGWRLTTAIGQAAGPLMISAITAAASLSVAAWSVAGIGFLGGAWLWHWADPKRMERPSE